VICAVLAGIIFAGILFPFSLYAIERYNVLGFARGVSDTVPAGWEHISYPGTLKNEFTLQEEGKSTVLQVKSLGSASAMLTRVDIDLAVYPVLAWRWRVNRVVGMAMETKRDRNDSAARVRVVFGSTADRLVDEEMPAVLKFLKEQGIEFPALEPRGYKIDYIWANSLEKGRHLDYPGEGNHRVIVVETGNDRAGRWIWEERSLTEDFRHCFGFDPPRLSAVLVLSDTDQTNEGVKAAFGNMVLVVKE